MNSLQLPSFALILLAGLRSVSAQGFVNLDFDTTTITPVYFPGGTRYTATIPGWNWNTGNFVNGDPNSVALNDLALDAPAVTLHDTNSPYYSSSFLDIVGGYSVLLQGGTTAGGLVTGNTNGASVYQTGQIPVWAQSLYYVGRGSQVTFNGQPLPIVPLGNFENVPQWGVVISGYAGQMGELRFTAPWHTQGSIDYLEFSTAVLPEPSTLTLATVFALCFLGIMRWPDNKKL